jgi:AraC-like DNA-binding protein
MGRSDLKPRATVAIAPTAPYARVVDALERLGFDRQALLERAGIAPGELTQPRGKLTLDQVEALSLAGAALVDRPGQMLDLGGTILFPSYGQLGLAALTAPSLEAAVRVAERHLELVTPLFVIEQDGDEHTLQVRLTTRYRLHPEARRIHLEFLLSTLYGLARSGVGRVPEGIRLTVPTRNARLHRWLEERGLSVRVSEDGTTLLEIPRSLAQTPFLMADPTAHAEFVAQCEAAMRELDPNDPMTRSVRDALKHAGPPFPNLETLCRQVGCSPRTLRRRLGDEGTGYQELLDEARFTWAKRALRHSRRPVTEIAYDLGYSAPSNFTRAFRRALGISPSAFRSSEHER